MTPLGPGTNVTANVRLLRHLGKGGMGSVWVAEHLTLDTLVAVKFISTDVSKAELPELIKRFEREAKAAARIKSPHVVEIYDRGVMAGGAPFIVMELLEGESLADRLERDAAPSLHEAAQIVQQVGKALGAAHALGVVHRDIKPENIFLENRPEHPAFVKILDFGIAKIVAEQLLNPKEADHRVDLWALAVVAYEMLTGQLPFAGETATALCLAICEAKFVLPSRINPALPSALDQWVGRGLCRMREGRFVSAKEMAAAFVRALSPSGVGMPAALFDSGEHNLLRLKLSRAEERRARRSEAWKRPEWLLRSGGGGEPLGPISLDQIYRALRAGEVPPDVQIARQGSSDWQLASLVLLDHAEHAGEPAHRVGRTVPGAPAEALVEHDLPPASRGTARFWPAPVRAPTPGESRPSPGGASRPATLGAPTSPTVPDEPPAAAALHEAEGLQPPGRATPAAGAAEHDSKVPTAPVPRAAPPVAGGHAGRRRFVTRIKRLLGRAAPPALVGGDEGEWKVWLPGEQPAADGPSQTEPLDKPEPGEHPAAALGEAAGGPQPGAAPTPAGPDEDASAWDEDTWRARRAASPEAAGGAAPEAAGPEPLPYEPTGAGRPKQQARTWPGGIAALGASLLRAYRTWQQSRTAGLGPSDGQRLPVAGSPRSWRAPATMRLGKPAATGLRAAGSPLPWRAPGTMRLGSSAASKPPAPDAAALASGPGAAGVTAPVEGALHHSHGRPRSLAGVSRALPAALRAGSASAARIVSAAAGLWADLRSRPWLNKRVAGIAVGFAAAVVLAVATIAGVLSRTPAEQPIRQPAATPGPSSQQAARPTEDGGAAPTKEAPTGMVGVAAGTFLVGCGEGSPKCLDNEKPAHRVDLAAFGIMVHEVTAQEYDECVAAGRCPSPGKRQGCTWRRKGMKQRPINCVTWDAAGAYCAWRGWRLPTEAQWEAAARGPKQPDYPWGNQPPSCDRTVVADANGGGCGSGGPLPVGSRPADRSWVGAFDMGGNVREWTASAYAAYPGGKADQSAGGKVNRGGSWLMEPAEANTTHTRDVDEPDQSRPDLGFRCALGL
ncbi:MAG: SUMF1/EgtB/PvdO family nonheme iron enzyme [Deltaproteobacteria bacterium]|nr:SUMF1/EgtB/PvdO family nonheme iron enzyme [Deltaproteobacteria bacterium]